MKTDYTKEVFRSIGVWVMKHLGISFLTAVLCILFMNVTQLIDDGAITGMYIVIVVVNCTAIICSKLNRIQERLDEIAPDQKDQK